MFCTLVILDLSIIWNGLFRFIQKQICIISLDLFMILYLLLRTVPTIVIAHTFCASRDTRVSYR